MLEVFVATCTDANDGYTEIVGVYSSRALGMAACQRHLDGTLDDGDGDTLRWNDAGTYAGVDLFAYAVNVFEVV